MKTSLTIIICMFLSILAQAQNGINYKALIKDNLGNVVANQTIDIEFTILQGVTAVYQETHTSTTDANGMIIVNIGEGNLVSGVFTTIDWGADEHFLKVQVDTGSGWTNMGTSQFKAVPYALQALKAGNAVFNTVGNVTSNAPGNLETDNFVFGSDQLDFNGAGQNVPNTRMFFNKTKGAFRAGNTADDDGAPGGSPYSGGAWNDAHLGLNSFASGNSTVASGVASTAMGTYTLASGASSTAMGYATIATNGYATAMGHETNATGGNSTAMGYETGASGNTSTAMGSETIASGWASTSMGNSTIASGAFSTSMGTNTFATGDNSTTMGRGTTASSYALTAIGSYNIGGGNLTTWVETDPLFEVGNGNSPSNKKNALTVLKNGNIGVGTNIPESKLQVAGDLFIQTNLGGLILGYPNNGNQWQFNTIGGGEDLLFSSKVEGSSTSSTRFKMKQGGEFQIGNISGTPAAWLHVKNNSTVNKQQLLLEEVGYDYARIGFKNTTYSDSNWDIAGLASNTATNARLSFYFRNSSGAADRMVITGDGKIGVNGTPTSRLEIFQGGQSVGTGLRFNDGTANSDWDITHGYSLRFHYGGILKSYINANTGAYVVSSDIRLKSDIQNMPTVLNQVEQLRPTTYTYKNDASKTKSLGFIAQEVQSVFPEVVHFSEADGLYGIDYAAFGVIAIKAIQEQQIIIENQQKQIDELKALVQKTLTKN